MPPKKTLKSVIAKKPAIKPTPAKDVAKSTATKASEIDDIFSTGSIASSSSKKDRKCPVEATENDPKKKKPKNTSTTNNSKTTNATKKSSKDQEKQAKELDNRGDDTPLAASLDDSHDEEEEVDEAALMFDEEEHNESEEAALAKLQAKKNSKNQNKNESKTTVTTTKPKSGPKVEAVVFNERPAAAAAAVAAAKIQKFKRTRDDGLDSDDELEKKGKRRTDDGLRLFDIHDLNIGKGGGTDKCPFDYSLNRVIKVEEISSDTTHLHNPQSETTVAARRFYAQRNMYLTGFTLFLSLILNRTFFMILDLLKSEEKMEIVKKQAAQQSKEYERVLASETTLKKELKELQAIVESHEPAKQDLENLKKQASQQQKEYLRMADENAAMEMKLKGIKPEARKDI
ncbi:hypothetical protein BGZ51_005387 [Haplosporangium sp. Z 767]|nr:hypothetical protein BGZ51_005387 [Haplosporangium sp. Z 767]KAF9181790.1 hypothetical protein BGZ50_005316 [Haplosporangium sp. Z 11]